MKNWISKLVFGAVLLSLLCFQVGPSMAMADDMHSSDSSSNAEQHCTHCMTQDVMVCGSDEKFVATNSNNKDLEDGKKLISKLFVFSNDASCLSFNTYKEWFHKKNYKPPSFKENNVVLRI